MGGSMKNHDTNLALAGVVMLPNDVADLHENESEEIQDLLASLKSLLAARCAKGCSTGELVEAGIPAEHPTWSKAVLEVEQLDSPQPYSPFVLLDFYEEKYLNGLTNDGLENPTEVADTGSNLELVATTGTSAVGGGGLKDDAPH
ncbi:hypothetical protein Acr_22g0003510 [Actinidia rufa]|uniref:Uncharacterized protein n=1 Tax=Actinidia rufa TaxID=165716 RepID=A0A7J0GJG3_9ERIC|nr:hypothetical protein Acr_22g0003510 [Actinidia rufa]